MYIDIEYLREQCDGQAQMMALLLNTFQQTGPEYIKRMEDSLAAEDYPELRQASHAFLSSLRILGAKEIACLLYTSPSPRDGLLSRMPSSA